MWFPIRPRTCTTIKPELFERFRWPFAEIVEDSPLLVAERDAEDQFRTWLKLWPAHSHIWIGDLYSSGRPEHRAHFRPLADWHQIGPVMGNFTCGSRRSSRARFAAATRI